MRKVWIILIGLLSFLIVTGCDHTELKGEVIVVNEETLHVGQNIPLVLNVPEELEGIYRVDWLLNDSEGEPINDSDILAGGEVVSENYEEAWIKDTFLMDEMDEDRIALFRPIESGTYTIEVYGFYNQTNPQPITEIILIIEE